MPSPTSLSSLATDKDCKVCSKATGERSIGCDKCDRWVHYSCADLTEEYVSMIINYFCLECEDEKHLTSWRKSRGTVAQRIRKEQDYYEVSNIIDHRECADHREFLIEWKATVQRTGRHEHSWEPEKHFDGAIDILQKYCRDKTIALSKIKGLLGASLEQDNLNRENWTTLDNVLRTFEELRVHNKISQDIVTKEWGQFETGKDVLYYLKHDFHCYAILYVHKLEAAYIADGGNIFRTDQNIANEIRQIVKIRLISVTYDQQLKIDHCASSAVLIGVEMIRMHEKGLRLYKLTTCKFYRTEV